MENPAPEMGMPENSAFAGEIRLVGDASDSPKAN